MSNIPEGYATCPVSYGEKKAHLVIEDHEGFTFHADLQDAMDAVRHGLRSGDKMIALMKVEALYRVKNVELEKIT